MARSLWKSRLTALTPNTDSHLEKTALLGLLSSAEQAKQNRSKVKGGSRFVDKGTPTQKIWSRSLAISPNDLGKGFYIYNGKNWVAIKIVEEMIGHKFGEFCYTRSNRQKKPKKVAYSRSK